MFAHYNDHKKILVTGAGGFIGSALSQALDFEGHQVRRAYHNLKSIKKFDALAIGDINRYTDWSNALDKVEVVVHCAARVHLMVDRSHDPMTEYMEVNFEGTLRLARQAITAGVERFIYISSIKADQNGIDPYSESKIRSEEALTKLCLGTNMKIVIVRPSLVYGDGVRGNFLRLMTLVLSRWPLPFKGIKNRRSILYLDNFIDLLKCCVTHPRAPGNIFNIADGSHISTENLVRLLAFEFENCSRDSFHDSAGCSDIQAPLKREPTWGLKLPTVFYIPLPVLRIIMSIFGKKDEFDRLAGSLEVDISKTKEILDWTPPISTYEGVARTARAFYCNRLKGSGK